MDYLIDVIAKPKRALDKIAKKPKFLVPLVTILVTVLLTSLICGNAAGNNPTQEMLQPDALLTQGIFVFARLIVELMLFALILYGLVMVFRRDRSYTFAHYWSLLLIIFAVVSIVTLVLSIILVRALGMPGLDISLGAVLPVNADTLPYILRGIVRSLHNINILHLWVSAILGMAIIFFSDVNKKIAYCISYGLYILPALLNGFFGG